MADIFLSYAHSDEAFAQRALRALERENFSVWWDHRIPPGKTWDETIGKHIDEAKVCIVLWSQSAAASDWVKEEASLAREAGKYLPALIDRSKPPVGFRFVQAAHLANWDGAPDHPQWRMLIDEAASLIRGESGQARVTQPGKTPRDADDKPTPLPRRLIWVGAAALAASVAAALFLSRKTDENIAPPLPHNDRAAIDAPIPADQTQTTETSNELVLAPAGPAPARAADDAPTSAAGEWQGTLNLTANDAEYKAITLNADGSVRNHFYPDDEAAWSQTGVNVIVNWRNGEIWRGRVYGDLLRIDEVERNTIVYRRGSDLRLVR